MGAFATPAVLNKRPMDWPLLSIPESLERKELEGINIHIANEDQEGAGETKIDGD